jgi:hypothetical protein
MSRPKAALSDEVSPLGSTSIQSVERAVALLRLFLPNVGSLGPTDIAQLSGMSVAFNSYVASSLAVPHGLDHRGKSWSHDGKHNFVPEGA